MTDRPEKIDLSDVKSRKVDENMLNELRDLFEKADEQKERYDFTWNGKAKAYFEAASPSTKTLKPDEKESVDFKNSKNLFIAGDNLEALKLMQESYLGKIDMVYVDPPYNTGKDFIYHDNFKKSKKESEIDEGIIDSEGNKLVKNDKSNGRYHSDWLSMIYSRIRLARNLLSDSGVIFVSIDDNEQANLKLIMNEVFGESNFEAQITVIVRPEGIHYGGISKTHEYLLVYSKNSEKSHYNEIEVKGASFKYKDEIGGFNIRDLRNQAPRIFNSKNRPNLRFPLWVDTTHKDKNGFMQVSVDEMKNYTKVLPQVIDGNESVYQWGRDKIKSEINNVIAKEGNDNVIRVYQKKRKTTQKARTLWEGSEFITNRGTREVKKLFDGHNFFDFPKTIELMKRILTIGMSDEGKVLDLFAGSGTTAEAVMQLNKNDNGNRSYILVTLDEQTSKNSDAYKYGYKTIDMISRDRIRRSAKEIGDNSGFRALGVSNSNLNEDVFKKASELNQDQLMMDIDNNSDNRSDYELLYDVLISSAFEYDRPISIDMLDDKKIIKYDYFGELSGVVAYFGNDLTDDLIRKISNLKPLIAVFKESTFDKSSQKVNLLEQFRITSPDTKVKVI
ncbi:site-specific DNA-methyltransferase [Apilactobacillus kunkeei]|uniref:site-specific DNA-methyltransferase n=1 Tax=Apilactobacillus kunkeei TaxID=148814 RepID=UPI0018DB4B13|nr:site-specific DNA-methyltransferase [Apilactobacillus kunkeei]MBI0091221.1 site-specific DNA-methyltransferase [Lactobacillus sp. M0345]MCX0325831.1 site-specific DNA-methyltransferase [Apilactobacillus kunkeei]